MSTDERLNPFAAPQTQATTSTLSAQCEIPLEPPIEFEGRESLAELIEAASLMTRAIWHPGKRVLFYVILLVLSVWALVRIVAAPSLPIGILLVVCGMLWAIQFINGPWTRMRLRKFYALQSQSGRRVRGFITSDGLQTIVEPRPPTGENDLDGNVRWHDFVEARLGHAALVLRRPDPLQARRSLFHIYSRSIFRNEADWQRFRDYVARRFDLLPKVIATAPCGRCRREYPLPELAPPSLLLRWLWPPMLLSTLLTNGRQVNYCRPCRRSVSFALFFIGFMLAVVLLMIVLSAVLPQMSRTNAPGVPRASSGTP
ncbi:MAG: hypothetical protein KF708_17125 [Pirellulales bacterium]|nr:hypothetical protein [Pirellulales bacterium]